MSQTQPIKAFFMSRPGTPGTMRRTWLIRIFGEPSQLVRIYPEADGDRLVCDCKAGKLNLPCEHTTAADVADRNKFGVTENGKTND